MADATVKYFESTQTGAPVLSGTSGALIGVLDAVLVNGFGLKTADSVVTANGVTTINISSGHSAILDSVVEVAGATPAALNGQWRVTQVTTNSIKFSTPGVADGTATGTITFKLPGAGWSKVYSKTNVAVYKSANAAASGCLIRIDDTGAQTVRWRGYEAMTDVDTGTGLFPTDAQLSGGLYVDKSSAASTAARGWTIIANDRAVYLGIDNTNTTLTNRAMQWSFFGDIVSRKANDAYRFMVSGNVIAAPGSKVRASSSPLWFGYYNYAYRWMAHPYSGIGGSIMVCPSTVNRVVNTDSIAGNGFVTPFPNPTDNALVIAEINIHETTSLALRGKLPGAYCPIQNVSNLIPDATVFDNVADLSGRRLLFKIVDAANDGLSGGVVVDVTGPWDY